MKIQYMTRIMKIFCLMSLVLMIPLLSEIERVPIEDRVYGIVHGESVSLRAMPDDKARINTKLKNYEFVAVTKIGEGKEEGWVKIYNIPGKEGWIKKGNIEVIDSNDKGFKEILNNQCRIGRMLNSVSKSEEIYLYRIKKIEDYYYVSYKIRDIVPPYLEGGTMQIYRHIDGSFREVSFSNQENAFVSLDENKMFIYGSRKILVKNIAQYITTKMKSEKYYYTLIARLSLNITKYLDSYMEFDPKTKIVTQYLRIKENQPYVVEKYQFKNDEFVQIGERQHEM